MKGIEEEEESTGCEDGWRSGMTAAAARGGVVDAATGDEWGTPCGNMSEPHSIEQTSTLFFSS